MERNNNKEVNAASEWQSVIERVQHLQHKAEYNATPLWYRGHASAEWELKSSLHRHVEELLRQTRSETFFSEEVKKSILRDDYKTSYRRFKADAWHLLDQRERSDWGIIFSMQHHGIPTRLLDWTESFACALFFAQFGRKPGDDAAIYVLDPHVLNQFSCGKPGVVSLDENLNEGVVNTGRYHPGWKDLSEEQEPMTIAVAPFLSNPRMLAQRSTFTLCGDSFSTLGDQFPEEFEGRKAIEKITLTAHTYYEVEKFLDLIGIGHFGYFPDLDGIRMKFKEFKERTIRTANKYIIRDPEPVPETDS